MGSAIKICGVQDTKRLLDEVLLIYDTNANIEFECVNFCRGFEPIKNGSDLLNKWIFDEIYAKDVGNGCVYIYAKKEYFFVNTAEGKDLSEYTFTIANNFVNQTVGSVIFWGLFIMMMWFPVYKNVIESTATDDNYRALPEFHNDQYADY